MTDRDLNNINEQEFDALLEQSLSQLPPPDDVANAVTPWKKAMKWVLWGLGLSTLTLNFANLDTILGGIGIILLLLGFRTLRSENRWFAAAFCLTILRAAQFFPATILQSTIWQEAIFAHSLFTYLTYVSLALAFLTMFCLWRALLAVQRKAGVEPGAKSAVALMVWYLILILLALMEFGGIVGTIVILASYIFILRSLWKLSSRLDEAGYAILPARIRIPDKALVIGLAGITAAGIAAGYLFFHQYTMEWTPVTQNEQPHLTEIRDHLAELGFPEHILDDLSEEDLAACENAIRVVVDVEDYPVNDGHEVRKTTGNHTTISTVYDVKELRITGVAVELPSDSERWKIFHHFQWLVDPGFYGTEAMQFWPAYYNTDRGWRQTSQFSGRVLHDQGGITYTAPYHSLGEHTYNQNSFFFGKQVSTDVFATFSFPRKSENQRGYICYEIMPKQSGYIINSWVNYVHQRTWFQYPVKTAAEYRMTSSWSSDGPFKIVQDALQFFSSEGTPLS